jgi:hypothetical protein
MVQRCLIIVPRVKAVKYENSLQQLHVCDKATYSTLAYEEKILIPIIKHVNHSDSKSIQTYTKPDRPAMDKT